MPRSPHLGTGQRVVHNLLGLAYDSVQMRLVLEAFRVDLVDVFRARGPGRKPAASGHHLQAADWGVVARGAGQLGGDRLSS